MDLSWVDWDRLYEILAIKREQNGFPVHTINYFNVVKNETLKGNVSDMIGNLGIILFYYLKLPYEKLPLKLKSTDCDTLAIIQYRFENGV